MNTKIKKFICEFKSRFEFDSMGIVDEDYLGIYKWKMIKGKYVIVEEWVAPYYERLL